MKRRTPAFRHLRLLTAPMIAAAVWLVASCSPPDDTSTSDAATGSADEPTTLTLLLGGSTFWLLVPPGNFPAMHLLYSPLFREDEETGEPRGKLVRSWEASEDGRTWTYRLRSDVRWHDGTPFTAHDVAFTHAFHTNPAVARWAPEAMTVGVLDDTTFTITYSSFRDPFNTWEVFLPRHLLEGLDPATNSEWEYWRQPIGYGPYRWVRTEPETLFELEANPDYFEGEPRIKKLLVKLGGNARVELLAGNVDAVGWPRLRGEVLRSLESDPRFRSYCEFTSDWSVTYLNHREPALSDARVRRALQHAIDREEAGVALDNPDGQYFDVPVSPRQIRRGQVPDPVPFDPQRAEQLLDEAGWTDTDGDGLRDRDGELLRLRATESGDGRLFVLLQQQLLRVGIQLEVLTMIESVGRERFNAGEAELFDVEGAGGGGLTLLRSLLEKEPRNDLRLGYDNPELARLVEELEVTFDLDERDRIYREMWPIFLEDAPVLFWPRQIWCQVAHRRVRGLSTPYRWNPETSMAGLWIEEE